MGYRLTKYRSLPPTADLYRRYVAGEPVAKLAAELKLGIRTIYRWFERDRLALLPTRYVPHLSGVTASSERRFLLWQKLVSPRSRRLIVQAIDQGACFYAYEAIDMHKKVSYKIDAHYLDGNVRRVSSSGFFTYHASAVDLILKLRANGTAAERESLALESVNRSRKLLAARRGRFNSIERRPAA